MTHCNGPKRVPERERELEREREKESGRRHFIVLARRVAESSMCNCGGGA